MKRKALEWPAWKVRLVDSAFKYLEEIKVITPGLPDLERFETAQKYLEAAQSQFVDIMRQRLEKNTDLRRYLMIHSVFPACVQDERTWFSVMMARLLVPTKEDLEWFTYTPKVSDQDLKFLAAFEPEVMGVEFDSVRIEYNSYGRPDPIHIIDLGWERIEEERRIASYCDSPAQYDDIPTVYTPDLFTASAEHVIEDDLPF